MLTNAINNRIRPWSTEGYVTSMTVKARPAEVPKMPITIADMEAILATRERGVDIFKSLCGFTLSDSSRTSQSPEKK